MNEDMSHAPIHINLTYFGISNCQIHRTFAKKNDIWRWCYFVFQGNFTLTRLALASIVWLFGVHLLKFTLDTHIWGYWNFRLEFVMRTHHNIHETYLIYPMSMIAISSLDFVLVFTCT